MSTGGGTTTQTTVQNTDPWKPAQPYLTDLMGQAQNLYNTSSQNTDYAPFNTVAPFSDQTQQALNATHGIWAGFLIALRCHLRKF